MSLDKCNRNFNAVDDLSTKICVPSETKKVNVKVFKMITRINEVKTLVKYKCNFDTTKRNLHKKWKNEKCQCEHKKYHTFKKKLYLES